MQQDNVRALRQNPRHALVLPAKCRSRSGFVDHVVISNLSPGGCRIDSVGLVFHVGDLLVIRPEGLEGLTGKIRWIKGHSAGIEFDRPLYGPVVEHLRQRHMTYLDDGRFAIAEGRVRRAA